MGVGKVGLLLKFSCVFFESAAKKILFYLSFEPVKTITLMVTCNEI